MTALLELLRDRPPDPPLTGDQWHALLAMADRTRTTTLLRGCPHLPPWFEDEISARVAKNGTRRERLWEAYREAAAALTRAGIAFVLLKGFTHDTLGLDPALRPQGDLDLLLSPQDIPAARTALVAIGYTPHSRHSLSADHDAPLVKPAGWQWHGDYYDPTFPAVIELHHALWSREHDRIDAPGIEAFWSRRTTTDIEGVQVPALCEADRLGFAALHLLRHILRNDASLAHAFELACALNLRAFDDEFWTAWTGLHPPRLRQLQTIAFQFAAQWFAVPLPAALEAEWDAMPHSVVQWFDRYALSPVHNVTEPDTQANKHALWLHLALLPSLGDRVAVARRSLLPLHVPRKEQALGRAKYHTVALARTLAGLTRRGRTASSASQTSS